MTVDTGKQLKKDWFVGKILKVQPAFMIISKNGFANAGLKGIETNVKITKKTFQTKNFDFHRF